MEKKCSCCKLVLSVELFNKCNKSYTGLQSVCKKCKAEKLSIYYAENPSKQKKRTKEQGRKRYAENKVNFNFSRRMRKSINNKKGLAWEKLVGYTLADLTQHLESLFTEGMSWENYGKWHIDHIIPLDYFKITGHEDLNFKFCWGLGNLQPLWSIENIKKGNKV